MVGGKGSRVDTSAPYSFNHNPPPKQELNCIQNESYDEKSFHHPDYSTKMESSNGDAISAAEENLLPLPVQSSPFQPVSSTSGGLKSFSVDAILDNLKKSDHSWNWNFSGINCNYIMIAFSRICVYADIGGIGVFNEVNYSIYPCINPGFVTGVFPKSGGVTKSRLQPNTAWGSGEICGLSQWNPNLQRFRAF